MLRRWRRRQARKYAESRKRAHDAFRQAILNAEATPDKTVVGIGPKMAVRLEYSENAHGPAWDL